MKIAEVEIIDGCNAHCVCCPRGNGKIKSTMKVMDFDLYKTIIDKLITLGIDNLVLFNWSEPFLNKNIIDYLMYAKQQNMITYISTNLSLPNIDMDCFKYIDHLVVSISGFTNDIYNINHKGLNIDLVKQNLLKINQVEHHDVMVKLFDYDYNKGYDKVWKEYLIDTDFHINIIEGNGEPLLGIQSDNYFGRLYLTSEDEIYRDKPKFVYCSFLDKITIDIHGNVMLCCEKMYDDSIVIGNFLTDDITNIQKKKLLHRECDKCNMFIKRMQSIKHFNWFGS